MSGLRRMSLTIILATDDPSRVRAALSVALAEAAIGGRVRLFAHERAVTALSATPRADDESAALAAAGLPDRLAMLHMVVEAGIELIACQTGLALTGMSAAALVGGAEMGGLVGTLATMRDDRLVSF